MINAIQQGLIYPLQYHYKYHKKQILLLMFFALLFVTSFAFCDKYSETDGLSNTVFSWIDQIFSVGSLDDAKDKLNVTFSDGTITAGGYEFTELNSIITAATSAFKSMGIFLLFIFFGVNLLETLTSSQQVLVESFIRKFVFLIIGIALLNKSTEIVFGLANIGTALGGKMLTDASTETDISGQISTLKEAIYQNMDLGTKSDIPLIGGLADSIKECVVAPIPYIVEMLVPWLLSKASNVMVSVVCWSRFVQILLMAVASPLIVCDLGDHFAQSNAMRGIKNVLALALSGPLILLSMYICRAIQFQIMANVVLEGENWANGIWSTSIIAVVQIGLITKAQGLAKQILGMA